MISSEWKDIMYIACNERSEGDGKNVAMVASWPGIISVISQEKKNQI